MSDVQDSLMQDGAQLRAERDEWKRIALWLADCHAATAAHEGTLRRTSKSSRDRLRSICLKAAEMIDVGAFTGIDRRERYATGHAVAKRLRMALPTPETEGGE